MRKRRINITAVFIEGFQVSSVTTNVDVNPNTLYWKDTPVKNGDTLIKTVERKTNEAFSDSYYWDFKIVWSDNSVDREDADKFQEVVKETEENIRKIANDTIRSIFMDTDLSDLVNRILRVKQEPTLTDLGRITKCGTTIREIMKAVI